MLPNRTVKVTKIFTFEMAHALLNYDGSCRNIHGHSYKLYVTIAGEPVNSPGHPKDGMVMDFKALKKLVHEHVIGKYDHALLLNEKTPIANRKAFEDISEKILFTAYQPTNENLVLDFVGTIKSALPENVQLSNLKLYETATSFVEWEQVE